MTGVQLVAVSYDSVDTLDRFAKKRAIQFELLSDPDSATIKAYGILNTTASGKAAGVPHPMTVLIDRDGMVRAKLGHEGYQTRHTVDQLLAAARSSTQPAKPNP